MDDFLDNIPLEDKGRFLRSVLLTTRDCFWVVDRTGRFVEVNEAYLQLSGYTRQEFLNKYIADLSTKEDPDETERHMQRIMAQGSELFETRHIGKDGRVIDIELSVTYLDMGRGYFICFCRDISERRRAEAEHQQLAMAIDQVGDVIVMTDAKGNIQFVNPAFERVTGYSRDEVVGQNPRLLKSGFQDLGFYQKLWQTISSGQTWHGRMVNKRRDGTLYTEEATISPVMDDGRNIVNYVAVKRDISPLLNMEKRLIQAEKLEAIGVLAGGIAHDFNNILFPIIGFSELLLDDLKDDEGQLSKVREIYSGAKRGADLVQQILAFGRQTGLKRHAVDVLAVVREALTLARSVIPNHFGIETDLGTESCFVHADSTQLHQMVMNLITNAYHAMLENGSGVIKVSVFLRIVNGAAKSAAKLPFGTYVAISVSDTGSGIDPDLAERIFEPYFTTKHSGRGTGLGLAIVHGLVREYGGDITVESEPGVGSTFSLLLPRLENAQAEKEEVEKALPGNGEHIMIVDDESAIVRMESIVLQRQGYTVSGFSLAVEALQAFKEDPEQFDLVITDMAMPGMTGQQLAAELLGIRPDLPVLICTGYSEQIDRKRLESLGVKGVLLKPLLGRDLANEVRRQLDEALQTRIRGRILIVDDEQSVRNLFRQKLSSEYCEILEAENGAQGLTVCRQEPLDLVVCDLIMPDKEGIETIMEIRREFPDLPVVAISGGGSSSRSGSYLRMAERLGARFVFAKPIDWSVFFQKVLPLLSKGEKI